MLAETVEHRQIDLVILDPFIKSHGCDENDNNAIDFVTGMLAELAIRFNLAIDAPHHVSKGMSDPGNANRGRGASAFKDGARLVYTLSKMTLEDASPIYARGKHSSVTLIGCSRFGCNRQRLAWGIVVAV